MKTFVKGSKPEQSLTFKVSNNRYLFNKAPFLLQTVLGHRQEQVGEFHYSFT